LDRIHGIDKEMSKYVFMKGVDCYDMLDDDLVDIRNDYITFIIRGYYPFPKKENLKFSFKDYERSFFNYMFNLSIADSEPKGYSEFICNE
jgi:hypothetical protein